MQTQNLGIPVPDWSPPAAPSHQIRHGQRCRLEPLDPHRHAAELFDAYAQDPSGQGWTYLPYGPFADAADYASWMDEICRRSDPLLFAIVDAATGQAIGVAGYLRITPAAGTIEIGHLHFSPRLQRTAMATEAVFLLMCEAFALGYRRLEWKCDALNQPSQRAAQRLGFRYEGTFRQATVVKGRNRDTAWFSIVDGEWPALCAAIRRWLEPGNFDADGRQLAPLNAARTAPRIAQLQLLAQYNRWMNVKVYAAAAALPPEELRRDRGAFFASILGTLNHIVVGDTLWLQRFARHPRGYPHLAPVLGLPVPPSLDAIVFDDLPDLTARRVALDELILAWVPNVLDEDLDRALHYTNSKGQSQSRNFHGLLTHFFNHQTHHRGQLTTLLTQAGVDVGVTDLVVTVPEQAD